VGRGMAVQVNPIKPTSKPPGTKRLKLKYDKVPSSFAYKFNSRHYTVVVSAWVGLLAATAWFHQERAGECCDELRAAAGCAAGPAYRTAATGECGGFQGGSCAGLRDALTAPGAALQAAPCQQSLFQPQLELLRT